MLKCIELTIYQICLKIFPDTVNFGVVQNTFLNLVFKEHDRQPSVSIFGISLNAKALGERVRFLLQDSNFPTARFVRVGF